MGLIEAACVSGRPFQGHGGCLGCYQSSKNPVLIFNQCLVETTLQSASPSQNCCCCRLRLSVGFLKNG